MFKEYKRSTALRLMDSGHQVEPRVQIIHGEAAFSCCYAAGNWNKLPERSVQSRSNKNDNIIAQQQSAIMKDLILNSIISLYGS